VPPRLRSPTFPALASSRSRRQRPNTKADSR
jgi:hypothetical protein